MIGEEGDKGSERDWDLKARSGCWDGMNGERGG